MKKTFLEWYQSVKNATIREQLIENCITPDSEENYLKGAIQMGFSWSRSPQGYKYWDEIYTYCWQNLKSDLSEYDPPLHLIPTKQPKSEYTDEEMKLIDDTALEIWKRQQDGWGICYQIAVQRIIARREFMRGEGWNKYHLK